MLPVFVYGTLRTASWNHERWLAPWLAGPCRDALLRGHALHHYEGFPYIVAEVTGAVVGELASLHPERYDAGLACLDELEDVAHRLYDRVEVAVRVGDATADEQAWVWVAGPRVSAALGPATLVPSGDFMASK